MMMSKGAATRPLPAAQSGMPPPPPAPMPAPSAMIWPESDRVLFFMISDFLRRRGLFRTADCLSGELEMDTAAAFLGLSQQIPGLMHSPAGFLAEWFAVFWELYAAHQTLKPTPTGNAKVASPPPPVMVPEQEAANKKLLLQRLMASVGLGNQEFAVLTADEKRLVNHLLSRYSPPANASMLSTSGASPNVKRLRTMVPPPERKPSVSSNIQTGAHLANLTSGTEPRPRSNSISSSSGQSPAFDGFHHVHSHPHHGSHQRISSNLIMSPDELMASLVQPQTTFNPSSLPELPGTGNSSSSKDSPLLSDLLRVKAQWGPFADKPSCLAYSGEQQLLAVGFRSGTVHILDPEGVKLPIELPHLHAQCTTQVRWRGAKLAAASLDKSVKLVDFGTSALSVFAVHTLNGHQAPVYAVEFVDDHSLCSCDGDGVLITWSLKDFTFRQTSLPTNGMVSARPLKLLRPNYLCIGNGDQIVCFDAKTCDVIQTIDTGLGKSISFLSSVHRDIMLVGTTETVSVFAITDDGRWRWQASKTLSGDKIGCMTWLSPRLIGVGGWNRLRVLRYNAHGRFSDVSQDYAHDGNVVGIANFMLNGDDGSAAFATVGYDGMLKTWALHSTSKRANDSFDDLFGVK